MKFIKNKGNSSRYTHKWKDVPWIENINTIKLSNVLSQTINRFVHNTYQNVNGILYRVGKTIAKSYGLKRYRIYKIVLSKSNTEGITMLNSKHSLNLWS